MSVTRRRDFAVFLAVNVIALALLVLAPYAPPPEGAVHDPSVARSLVTKWVPWALAWATVLTALLALRAPAPHALYRRHALFYAVVPATGVLVQFADDAEPALYCAPLVLLVAATAVHGLAALWEMRHAASDRAVGLLLGVTVLATALALLPYDRTIQLPQSDEPHYLLIMQSIVRDRDIELTNDYDGEYPDLFGGRLPDRHIIQVGNAQWPIRDLGLPALGALPFALWRRTGVLIFMALVGAAFAWRGYALLRSLSFGRSASLAGASGAALLHPGLTYTTQIYPDLPAALAVLLVAEALARPLTMRRALAGSLLCGLLPWLTLRAWFVALPLGLVLLVVALRSRDARIVLAAVLPGAALVVTECLASLRLFGIFLPSAGYFVIRDQQAVITYTPWLGLPGLFLDRTFGLLARAPHWALAFFGAIPLWRRARGLRSPALIALGLASLVEILYIGDIAYWWADGSPSSRYLVATLPFLMCALAAGIERLRGSLSLALAVGAASWSACVTFVFALQPGLRYDYAKGIATGDPGELWRQVTFVLRLDPGLLFPSLVRAAAQDAILTAAWLVLLAALVAAGARRARFA